MISDMTCIHAVFCFETSIIKMWKRNTPSKQTSAPSPTPIGYGPRGDADRTTVHLPVSGMPFTAFRRYARAAERDRSRRSSDLRPLCVIAAWHSSECWICRCSHCSIVTKSESRRGGFSASTGKSIRSLLICSCTICMISTTLEIIVMRKTKTSMTARGSPWSILVVAVVDTSHVTHPIWHRLFVCAVFLVDCAVPCPYTACCFWWLKCSAISFHACFTSYTLLGPKMCKQHIAIMWAAGKTQYNWGHRYRFS